jgi:hypothetical protein
VAENLERAEAALKEVFDNLEQSEDKVKRSLSFVRPLTSMLDQHRIPTIAVDESRDPEKTTSDR